MERPSQPRRDGASNIRGLTIIGFFSNNQNQRTQPSNRHQQYSAPNNYDTPTTTTKSNTKRILWLKRFNLITAILHFVNTIAVMIVYLTMGKGSSSSHLTVNRLLVRAASGVSGDDNASHWNSDSGNTSFSFSSTPTFCALGGCLDGTHYAEERTLKFRSSTTNNPNMTFVGGGSESSDGTVTLNITPFPSRTNYELRLGEMIICFFFLSFIFQIAVMYASKNKYGKRIHLYDSMFASEINHSGENEEDGNEDKEKQQELLQGGGDVKIDKKLCIITINWLRYVEYSISASIMMLSISLVAGILDFELLMCICFLTFSCMLAGYGAEAFLRIGQALKDPDDEATSPQWNYLLNKVSGIANNLAVILHVVGWVCIVVPFIIIMSNNFAFWQSDSIARDCAKASLMRDSNYTAMTTQAGCDEEERSLQPPQFVMVIMISQSVLFALFGFVQLRQILWPNEDDRISSEFAYVFLSMVAKTILGWSVAAGLFVQSE